MAYLHCTYIKNQLMSLVIQPLHLMPQRTLLKSITNISGDPVTFNSTNTATFSFDLSDGDNRKILGKKTFYVVADVGPSTILKSTTQWLI